VRALHAQIAQMKRDLAAALKQPLPDKPCPVCAARKAAKAASQKRRRKHAAT
jgi:hypothetical protein